MQLDDYLQFGITANAERIEQILESLDMNSDEISPLNKCMDTCDLRLINDTNDRINLEKK